MDVLERASQSPDLNLIKSLWIELKIRVIAWRTANHKELEFNIRDKSRKPNWKLAKRQSALKERGIIAEILAIFPRLFRKV